MKRSAYLEQRLKRRREMRKLRDAGWSLKAIGQKFGISYQAVQEAIKRT